MSALAHPEMTVLVPTRNRASLLEHLLRSLDIAQAAAEANVEFLIIDNGSNDETPALIDRWVAAAPGRKRLFVAQPGQSHALNCGIRAARGSLLAFTDDDVEVVPSWVRTILDFFAQHPAYDAAMGRVLIPQNVTDPELIAKIHCYETLPLFDRGDAQRDVSEMYGCNMVLRRRVIETVGMFDERLGPGTSGFGGDTDLCERIVHADMRIGYIPEAVVYHAVDGTRLTPQFFRDYHRRKAHSDFERARDRFCQKNVSRLLDASLRWAWCSLVGGQTPRRMRARMRMIRHAEFLRLRWRMAWSGAGGSTGHAVPPAALP